MQSFCYCFAFVYNVNVTKLQCHNFHNSFYTYCWCCLLPQLFRYMSLFSVHPSYFEICYWVFLFCFLLIREISLFSNPFSSLMLGGDFLCLGHIFHHFDDSVEIHFSRCKRMHSFRKFFCRWCRNIFMRISMVEEVHIQYVLHLSL